MKKQQKHANWGPNDTPPPPALPPQRFNKKLENINANNIRMFVDLSANSFIFA